jgi:hypothetical protein
MHLATKFVSFFFNYFPYPTSYQEGCVIASIFFTLARWLIWFSIPQTSRCASNPSSVSTGHSVTSKSSYPALSMQTLRPNTSPGPSTTPALPLGPLPRIVYRMAQPVWHAIHPPRSWSMAHCYAGRGTNRGANGHPVHFMWSKLVSVNTL